MHKARWPRAHVTTLTTADVSRILKKNLRDFFNQAIWLLDHLRTVAPDEERLLRDIALGGSQSYSMWSHNDLRDTFAFNLERYGLVRFDDDTPILLFPLLKDALRKPSANEFAEQKRQLKGLVDDIEMTLRARLAVDCSEEKSPSESVNAIVAAIPSDAKNRPLSRKELLDLGAVAGITAVLESMNWGDYEILLGKFYEVIRWNGAAVERDVRLRNIKKTFLDAHLVRHNNDSELRSLIRSEGYAALHDRFCGIRDMFAA